MTPSSVKSMENGAIGGSLFFVCFFGNYFGWKFFIQPDIPKIRKPKILPDFFRIFFENMGDVQNQKSSHLVGLFFRFRFRFFSRGTLRTKIQKCVPGGPRHVRETLSRICFWIILWVVVRASSNYTCFFVDPRS